MTEFEKIIKDLRRGLVTVWGFSIVASILLLATPLYMASVYDRVLSSRSLSTLAVLTIIAVAALLAHGAIDSIRRLILSRMATRLDAEVSSYLLEHSLMNESARSEKAMESMGHLNNIRSFITGPSAIAIFDIPIAPIFLVLMFFLHPVLGMITAGGAVVLAGMAIANQRISDPLTKEANKHSQEAMNVAHVLTRNGETIRSMGMLDNAITVWGRPQANSLIASQQATGKLSGLVSFSKVVRMLLQMATLGVGGLLAVQGLMSPGLIFVASIVSGRALQPIDAIISNWKTIMSARNSYGEIQQMIGGLAPMRATMRYSRPSGQIDVEQLGYAIKGSPKPILQGFSFAIPSGRSVGLIGPSGAGKSTLARILAGSISPTNGVVKYDGIDIATWDRNQLGNFIGYVPQDIELFPGTIAQNIARMDPDMSTEAVIEVSQLTGIHDFIQNMPNGYNTEVGPGAFRPSGGQRQRIAIARAFYGNPSVIIMDEPNASLDGAGEEALVKAIESAKSWGATIIVVSHRPALLQAVDTVLVIENGRIVDYGVRDEVLGRQSGTASASSLSKNQKSKPQKTAPKTKPDPLLEPEENIISTVSTQPVIEPPISVPSYQQAQANYAQPNVGQMPQSLAQAGKSGSPRGHTPYNAVEEQTQSDFQQPLRMHAAPQPSIRPSPNRARNTAAQSLQDIASTQGNVNPRFGQNS